MSVKMNSDTWSTVTYTTATTPAVSDNMFAVESVNPASFRIEMPSFPTKLMEDAPAKGTFPSYVSMEYLVYYSRKNKDYSQNETSQTLGALEFVNVKELLARFFVGVYFRSERVGNWRSKCVGISSMIEAPNNFGNHMPMFDYDGNVKKKIRKDVADFQDKYGLGDAWVYRTKKGFHVYFFCDQVAHEIYMQMLKEASCCQGFKERSMGNQFSILRVSAKYTRFDIELEYILKSKNTSVLKRPLKKAHVIQELISLGQQCGTHLASLYPQWARFREDAKEWRAPPKPKTRRVRRKSGNNPLSPEEVLHMKRDLEFRQMKDGDSVRQKDYERWKQQANAGAKPEKVADFNKALNEIKMKWETKENQPVQTSTHGFVSTNPESIFYVAEPKAKHVSEEDDGDSDDLGDDETEF